MSDEILKRLDELGAKVDGIGAGQETMNAVLRKLATDGARENKQILDALLEIGKAVKDHGIRIGALERKAS